MTLLYALILIPAVQTMVVRYFTNQLSMSLNTEISIGRIHFVPFKRVVVNDLLIRDQQSDTLLFMSRFNATVDSFSIKNKKVYLKRVRMVDPQVKIYQIDSVDYNYSFIARQFFEDRPETDSVSWKVFPSEVSLVDGKCEIGLKSPNVIDYRVGKFDLNVKNISYHPDSIYFKIGRLAANGFRGVTINDASAEVGISGKSLMMRNFSLSGNRSSVLVDSLMVGFAPEGGQLFTFDSSNFFADITHLKINSDDIAALGNGKLHFLQDFTFSGTLRGTGDNIKGRNILLGYGEKTSLLASFDLKGLPDLSNSFLYLDIKELITNSNDIAMLASAGLTESVTIPRFVEGLGEITYSGNITGFLYDLVAYGKWKSRFGTVNTDLGLKWKEDNKLYFAGAIRMNNFRVGSMINSSAHIGNMSMSVLVSGSYLNSSEFFTYIDGNVSSLNINGYDYKNIQLGGLFNPRRFDGKIVLNDPAARMRFMGSVDYSLPMPQFAFELNGTDIDLEKLGLFPSIKDGILSYGLNAYFTGESIDDVVGEIGLSHLNIKAVDRSLNLDSLMVSIERIGEKKRIKLVSDIADGELTGSYNFKDLGYELTEQISMFSKSLFKPVVRRRVSGDNVFDFKVNYHDIGNLVRFFYPDVTLDDKGAISGYVDSQRDLFSLNLELGDGSYKDIRIRDFSFSAKGEKGKKAYLNLRTKEIGFGVGRIQNLSLQQTLANDSLISNIFWNNWGEKTNSGAVFTNTSFKRGEDGLYADMSINPSDVMFEDSLWHVSGSKVFMGPQILAVLGFKFGKNGRGIEINGIASQNETDKMKLRINNIDLGQLLNVSASSGYMIDGLLNADIDVYRALKEPIVNSDLYVSDFVVNRDSLGYLSLNSEWQPEHKAVILLLDALKDKQKILSGGGEYRYDSGLMNLNFTADKLPAGFLNFYLSHIIQNIKGTTSGKIHLGGKFNQPELSARLKLNPTTFDVNLLKTSYTLTDSVILEPDRMIFKNMRVTDRFNNNAVFSGTIGHNLFSNFRYDLKIDCRKILGLDTRANDNPDYYGTVFADGRVSITGRTSDISIDVAVKTMPGTSFFVPLDDDSEASATDFIRFVSPSSGINAPKQVEAYKPYTSSLDLNFDIEVTPDAKIQVLFDGKNGDILKGSGRGDVNVRIDKLGKISFFGEYVLEDGNYLFSFQNIVNKRFVINSGSSVRWDGNPYDAQINLSATYKLKASLYELVSGIAGSDATSTDLKRRVPINLNLFLADRIMRPSIRFDIETPSTQDVNQNIIDQYVTSEEELNRQVLSLLILNRFYTPDNAQVNQNAGNRSGNNAALVTTTEVLSSQLSNWLSQISNDFDVGVAYRPGDEITNEEIEVALSTQIFNNRVILNGNLGYGRNQTAASNIIGDFDMEVKLNNSGSVRAKAYTHSNNDLIYETSPTTQGVGVSFREEFNTFGDLLRRYWAVISGEKRRSKKQLDESANNEVETE